MAIPSNSRPIRFLLGGKQVEVADLPATTTVLEFLRQHARRPGTKEGCAEGDCGACTVVLASVDAGGLRIQPINACIQFLPTLDGKALFTVEDVRRPDSSLHPVQQAMVDCHASQCGFCTPGFVMSLWATYLENCASSGTSPPLTEAGVREAVSGNLCRCTGYRPIIEAGMRMQDLPISEFDRPAIETAIRKLDCDEALVYGAADQRFFAPRTLQDFVMLREQLPGATVLAGGTDIGLWANKQFRNLGDLIYTGAIAELQTISSLGGALQIGAAVTLTDTWRAMQPVFPELNEIWERFASTPVRNAGTLGGNIANGSPIGDSMPALIVLGAKVELASHLGQRKIPLEDLYIGYQKKSMGSHEVISSIQIPARSAGLKLACYKLSKRYDSDISAVCGAFALVLEGDQVKQCRVAFGGMAAIPRRSLAVERFLTDATWSESTVRRAMDLLGQDFSPLDDARATASYRLQAAKNMIYRFYLESRCRDPLPAAQFRVFA